MQRTKGEKLFGCFNAVWLILIALICFAPVLYVLAMSLSSSTAITAGRVSFWPVEATTIGYEYILGNRIFWRSMYNSVVRVVLGVGLNIIMTCLSAYPLSRSHDKFYARTFFAWLFFIPMLIGGGLIPTYIVVSETGLLNTIWALILPGAVPIFYVLLLLNFFRQLPRELEEAAIIDGAGHWRILLNVFIPLSKPALATICVYAILGQWNSWFDGSIYLDELSKFPLMTYMRTIVVSYDPDKLTPEELKRMSQLGTKTLQSAQIFVATMPILLTYPFFQKYFTKGLTVGSVKG